MERKKINIVNIYKASGKQTLWPRNKSSDLVEKGHGSDLNVREDFPLNHSEAKQRSSTPLSATATQNTFKLPVP